MVKPYDTIIIGGGPAGLSAAKQLGFWGRDVLVIDRGVSPLNYYGNPIYNYPGINRALSGKALLRQFQGEARALGAQIVLGEVTQLSGEFPHFEVIVQNSIGLREAVRYQGRTLLLATGVAIMHPKVNQNWQAWLPFASRPGVCYYCVDCEAPLVSGKSVLLLSVGSINQVIDYARLLQRFTNNIQILVLKDGAIPFSAEPQSRLDATQFEYAVGTIKTVTIVAPGIKQIITTHEQRQFTSNCFFVSTIRVPRSNLVRPLGVAMNQHGAILTDEQGQTNIAGIWAAGDVRPLAKQIAVAVGSGNYAALMINRTLSNLD